MIRTIQRKFRKSRGFTLVELMIVVAIVGILAALAIYGVRKYMASAKSAEAKNSLGQLSKDASSAYNREHMAAVTLAAGSSAGVSNAICVESSNKSVPATIAGVTGSKYQSAPANWDTDNRDTGWACLKFSMAEPQYYMYTYTSPSITAFAATANGDLDADTTQSTFRVDGAVRDETVVLAPSIFEDKAEE